MSDKKFSLIPQHGEDLHPAHVERLRIMNDQRNEEVEAMLSERRRLIEAAQNGETEDDEVHFADPKSASYIFDPHSFSSGYRRNRGRNRGNQNQRNNKGGKNGKGGKGGNGGGGGRVIPSPQVALQAVQQILAPLPVAGMTGNIQFGDFNGQFLDKVLASHYEDSYKELLSRYHVLLMEEVAADGIDYLKQATGYQSACSVENTRHQAVAIMWNPRFKLVNGPVSYTSLANVQGVPDLRPALRVDLQDTVTGKTFSFVVLHLKSMRGGPATTAVVRSKQFALLVRDLGPEFEGIVGGDLNYIIDDPNNHDADPMFQAGFTLVAPNDHSATQAMGSRIDGLFVKGLDVPVDYYRVFAFFADPRLGRAFSDHGATKAEICVSSKKSNQSGGSGVATTDSVVDSTKVDAEDLPFVIRVDRVVKPSERKPVAKPSRARTRRTK